jgi:hypothetical protein
MQLKKIRTTNKAIKDIVYQVKATKWLSTNNLIVTEHFVNEKQKGVTVEYKGKLKDIWPTFLPKSAFSKKQMDNFDNYPDWICKNYKEIKTLKDLEKYYPYLNYNGGHILFDINEKPISLPLSFDYIGSLEEKSSGDENYAKLISLLKKHPYILKIEEQEIPYYNSNFQGQKGILRATAFIPQKEYEKLYRYCIDFCKGRDKEFWSCSMHDIMKLSYNGYEYDLYGKEITELLKKHYTTETTVENSDNDEE